MTRHQWRRHPPTLIALLFTTLARADLPYIPTQLLSATQSGDPLIYILDPPSSSLPSGRLRALSPTKSFTATDSPAYTLSDTLPFVGSSTPETYTASLDNNGNIVVVAGDCTTGASGSSIWKFTPSPTSSNGNGTWTEQSFNTANLSGSSSTLGTNFLASSISFSPSTKANSSTFVFGGMCPFANSTATDWTSAATYSNNLLVVEEDSVSQYDFKLETSSGEPIAEAGFSITPLAPTFSNSTDGSGTQSEQQAFLLLGGHTGNAFINMSQVAIFSLPQTTWTFQPVSQYNGKTDLMTRDTSSLVEPRSGHTALLTSDGTRVIMYGGWVGDVSTPAEPQLAVLDIGVGYGGSGSWSWAQQPAQPSLSSGSGLYGHGASMLSGDVMMVTGGYSTSTGGSKRAKRSTLSQNGQTLFYNVSSNAWVSSYDYGLAPSSGSDQTTSGGPLSTQPQKVGLGIGLTLGFLALGIAGIACWILARRFKREEESQQDQDGREKEIEDLNAAANYRQHPDVLGISGAHGHTAYPSSTGLWDGRQNSGSHPDSAPNVWKNDSVREAERTGLDLDIPSPQRGLRRSHVGRNMHSASRYDDIRMVRSASGTIHPIEERDEEEIVEQMRETDDPFRDPSPTRTTDAPNRIARKAVAQEAVEGPIPPVEERTRQTSVWVQQWAAAAAKRSHSPQHALANMENDSPEKSERTRSDLSEQSTRSAESSSGYSGRTTHAQAARVARGGLRILPAAYNPFATSPSSSPTRASHPTTPCATSTGADGDSFSTAHTNFVSLQAESDALLGPAQPGQAQPRYPLFTHDRHVSPESLEPDTEPTFTFARGYRAPSSKVGGWVGSMRRAINSGRSSSMTSTQARAEREGGLGGLMVYETRGSAASSPTKKGGVSTLAAEATISDTHALGPRRSASDGASFFLAGKRATGDGWPVTDSDERRTSSMAVAKAPGWKGAHGDIDDDAARVVDDSNFRVMYTVSKERLHVVNAELDGGSVSEAGDGLGWGRHRV